LNCRGSGEMSAKTSASGWPATTIPTRSW